MRMPEALKYYTADEVAETLPLEDPEGSLYRKLWGFLNDAENPTPLGGDGSDGTVEEPAGRLSLENDDKAGHWWSRLNEAEQYVIVKALHRERRGEHKCCLHTGMCGEDSLVRL